MEEKEDLKEEDIEKLKQANISLIIDTYDDIFSDFDPRDFNQRALSDDFLIECKKAARDKLSGIELRIMVPKSIRNFKDESKIKKRLLDHFKHHYSLEEKQIRKIVWEGISWFGLGTIFILSDSWLKTLSINNFGLTILSTILEPAGWFSFWEGLGKVFITAKEKSENYEFYKKMSDVEINFLEY
ncbi:Uncharacterised protein [uncultured archaeon]|nr:Uncharacterised protein [uncultured archaeon]